MKESVYTTTQYPNWKPGKNDVESVRGTLALEFIKVAQEKNRRLVVVDEMSSPMFQESLRSIGVMSLKRSEPGMSQSRREGLRQLLQSFPDTEIVVWSEPEKVDLVSRWLPLLTAPISEGKAAIVIPKRTEASWQTYPLYQRTTEEKANRALHKLFKAYGLVPLSYQDEDYWLDLMNGPRVFAATPEVVSLFFTQYEYSTSSLTKTWGKKSVAEYSEYLTDYLGFDLWNESIFFPVTRALLQGVSVTSVPIDFCYPPQQKAVETGVATLAAKRKRQWTSIVAGNARLLQSFTSNTKQPRGFMQEK